MRLGRCPVCHSHIDLVAMVEDEAGRELLAFISKLPPHIARALLPYLTLFRTGKRDLSLSRTLILMQEALNLTGDKETLAAAMLETTESIRNKQSGKPLKNHNYLKQVLAALQQKHGGQHAGDTGTIHEKGPAPKHKEFDAYKKHWEALGYVVDDTGRIRKQEDV